MKEFILKACASVALREYDELAEKIAACNVPVSHSLVIVLRDRCANAVIEEVGLGDISKDDAFQAVMGVISVVDMARFKHSEWMDDVDKIDDVDELDD